MKWKFEFEFTWNATGVKRSTRKVIHALIKLTTLTLHNSVRQTTDHLTRAKQNEFSSQKNQNKKCMNVRDAGTQVSVEWISRGWSSVFTCRLLSFLYFCFTVCVGFLCIERVCRWWWGCRDDVDRQQPSTIDEEMVQDRAIQTGKRAERGEGANTKKPSR